MDPSIPLDSDRNKLTFAQVDNLEGVVDQQQRMLAQQANAFMEQTKAFASLQVPPTHPLRIAQIVARMFPNHSHVPNPCISDLVLWFQTDLTPSFCGDLQARVQQQSTAVEGVSALRMDVESVSDLRAAQSQQSEALQTTQVTVFKCAPHHSTNYRALKPWR